MKKLFILLLTIASSISSIANAEVNTEALWSKYTSTGQEILSLYRQLKINEVIAQVKTVQNTNYEEVITGKNVNNRSSSGGGFLSLFFLSAGGSYNSQDYSSVDVSKMVLLNAEEVAQASEEKKRQFQKVQLQVYQWMEDHAVQIAAFKRDGVEFVSTAYELVKKGEDVNMDDIAFIEKIIKNITFNGAHEVIKCVNTQYANSSSQTKRDFSGSIGISLLFGLFGGAAGSGHHSDDQKYQYAHKVSECTNEVQNASVSTADSLYKINYSLMDRRFDEWTRAVKLAYETRQQDILYPTFDLQYFDSKK